MGKVTGRKVGEAVSSAGDRSPVQPTHRKEGLPRQRIFPLPQLRDLPAWCSGLDLPLVVSEDKNQILRGDVQHRIILAAL